MMEECSYECFECKNIFDCPVGIEDYYYQVQLKMLLVELKTMKEMRKNNHKNEIFEFR